MTQNVRLGLIPGDPNGVGPELLANLLHRDETFEGVDITLFGDPHVIEKGLADANQEPWPEREGLKWEQIESMGELTPAEATREGGLSILRSLGLALEQAELGNLDAVMFLPFNKAALHLADLGHEDEIRWMQSWWGNRLAGGKPKVGEINIMAGLWSSRVTSHVPLSEVAPLITEPGILDAIDLLNSNLIASGIPRPRIGVAALNPHAGDGGNFGREEIDIITPTVAKAQKKQLAVEGPYPSDTLFLKARDGAFDGVVTMYHDQGQIAMKLMGFSGGVTVLGGMPVPIGTPAHGTAYDIVGQGKADMASTEAAFKILTDMARSRIKEKAAA